MGGAIGEPAYCNGWSGINGTESNKLLSCVSYHSIDSHPPVAPPTSLHCISMLGAVEVSGGPYAPQANEMLLSPRQPAVQPH